MIVLDASAAIEWLLRTSTGENVDARLSGRFETLHAPHLLDIEVAQVLRRQAMARVIPAARARQAIDDLLDLTLTRYPHTALLERAWDLRENLTAFDAVYIALAEALDVPLVTCDARLAAAPGHRAQVEVITGPEP